MDLKSMTLPNRKQRLKEIFRHANTPGVSQGDVAKKFWMTHTSVSNILHGKTFGSLTEELGLTYSRSVTYLQENRRCARKLTKTEIDLAQGIVNRSSSLQAAVEKNPYNRFSESLHYHWVEHMITSLWSLRGAKLNIFADERYTGMPRPIKEGIYE